MKGARVQREYRDKGQGHRETLTQQEMWEVAAKAAEAQAEQEHKNVLEEPMSSTAQEAFQAPPPGAYTKPIGQRVMKTRNARDIPNDTRDIQFLVEAGIRQPDTRINYSDVGNGTDYHLPECGKDLYNSTAITFYNAPVSHGGTQGFSGRKGHTDNRKTGNTISTPIEYCTVPEKD